MRISKVDILSGGYVELLKKQNQLRRSVANFLEIVKGFGMFPNKILQKVSKAEILQNARVGTAVHCLPEW